MNSAEKYLFSIEYGKQNTEWDWERKLKHKLNNSLFQDPEHRIMVIKQMLREVPLIDG